jgi:uncharacterized damage-inducible protein DinB
MSTANPLLAQLFAHLAWANARVLEALRTSPEAEGLRLFAHVVAAEEVWLARIEQRRPRNAVWPQLSLDECALLSSDNERAFAALLADEARLATDVRYTNSAGFEFRNSVTDVLTHVAMHGAYHRGQIARAIRGSGETPPYTDFIGYARREQEGGTEDAGRARR